MALEQGIAVDRQRENTLYVKHQAGWRTLKLRDVARYINGYAFKPSDWNTEGLPIIRIQNLNDPSKPFNYFTGKIPEKYCVHDGDILISWSASLGTYMWRGEDAWLNQHIFKAIVDEEIIDREFFFWTMRKEIGRIADLTHGSTMKHVVQKTFLDVDILLPSPEEQKAIASVLRAVDNTIQARRNELELERERKAALMQHLFTRGTRGEATKQTEIGEMPESWNQLKLGEVITLQRGFDLPTSQRTPGKIPVVSSSGISGTHNFAKVVGPGVVTGRYGTIGQVFYIETDFWPLNTTLFVSDFKGNDPKFISYFLQTINLQVLNDKTSVPGINRNHAHAILVGLPSFEEQHEIAAILQACDSKITALGKEIALQEELFRALLEELMSGRLSALPLVEAEGGAREA